eukprot:s1097_g4.t1
MSAAQMAPASGEVGRPALFAVPATPFVMKPAPVSKYARSVSTFRGGLPPSGYQLDRRAISPVPMRWVSPIHVRAIPGGQPAPRSFSPSRQGSPLAVRSSRTPELGIVFPGAAVLRPPLLPVDQHIKAMPVHSDDGQIRTTRQSDSSFDLVLLTCMLGRLRAGSLPEEDVSSDGVTRAFAHDYAGSSAGTIIGEGRQPHAIAAMARACGACLPHGATPSGPSSSSGIGQMAEDKRSFRRICVYGGSSAQVDGAYLKSAADLGTALARHGIGVVFGGGKAGMMGAIADAALAQGAEVIGVIPRNLVEKEVAHTGCTCLRVVESMHQRKALMAELADAFIALPGGWGTLEEFSEVVTWTQLNIHLKPVGLLNKWGFWDHVLRWAEQACEAGFLSMKSKKMVSVSDDPDALIRALQVAELPDAAEKLGKLQQRVDTGVRASFRTGMHLGTLSLSVTVPIFMIGLVAIWRRSRL